MCALKAFVLIYFIVSAVLMTSTLSNAHGTHHGGSKDKTPSGYKYHINALFSERSMKKKVRYLAFRNNTPSVKIKVQLYCRTGFLLEVLDNGKIAGTQNVSSEHTILEIQVFGNILRRLKGVASGRYLSLNNRGRLSSTHNGNRNMNTFFNERHEENNWISYSSSLSRNCGGWKKGNRRGNEWFIAIKKNGALKRPCKTEPGMHSTQFIVIKNEREANMVEESSLASS